jgi:cell division protein FtsW
MRKSIDPLFFLFTGILALFGFFIFTSASLGLLSGSKADLITTVALKQLLLGLGIGGIACYITSHVKYTFWRSHAFYIFLGAFILTMCVFVPGLSVYHNGARRWIDVGLVTFQPSELLKYAYLIYLAAWFSNRRKDPGTARFGLIPFLVISAVVSFALILQPDTDTLAVMLVAGASIYVASGARLKHILLLILIGAVGLTGIIFTKPYIKDRIMTFFDPASNPLSSGYQIQQSLIAVGSGKFFGKGFGQSVQKFGYLPEPMGDSIFAVAAEEFGFIGASGIVILFLLFALRGLKISSHAPDSFASLLSLGIVILIITQAYMNIAAMLAIIPLSGQTLPLVSHGGTALMVTLTAIGIVFNISRYQKKS